jgi:hypothetical protein
VSVPHQDNSYRIDRIRQEHRLPDIGCKLQSYSLAVLVLERKQESTEEGEEDVSFQSIQTNRTETIISFRNSKHNVISRATISITTFHTIITNPFFLVATFDEIFKSVFFKKVSHQVFVCMRVL